MSKISNPWLTPLQRGYNQIKSKLLNRVKDIKDSEGNPLITDYSEGNIFVILISLFSAIAEVLHYYIDNVGRESFFVTARRYSSLVKHASLLDYYPKAATPPRVEVVLSRTIIDSSVSSDITLPNGLIFKDTQGNTWITEQAVVWYSNTTTCRVPLVQKELCRVSSLNGNFIPSTEGRVILELPQPANNNLYVHGSLDISIDGEKWNLVETLAHSKPHDKHFLVYLTETGAIKVLFGDNTFGSKPLSDSTITSCSYYSTKGSKANIYPGTITTVPTYISSRVSTVTCNNPLAASGGSNYEDFFKLKSNVPLSVKTLGVAITKEDYKNLALLVPGVSKAAVEYECGRRINIYISPTNGGIASSNLCTEVQKYVSERSTLTTRLVVKPVGEVGIKLDISVTGKKSCSAQVIKDSIVSALMNTYSPNNVDISSNVRISDIYALLDNLPVVDHLFINRFYTKPYPTTLYGNTQLVISSFDIISSNVKDSMEYIVVFTSSTQYYIRAKYNGYASELLTVDEVGNIQDIENGFNFSLSISPNSYLEGFKYKFVVAKPNYDYTEPGYNMPVFTNPDEQLTLTVNEVI